MASFTEDLERHIPPPVLPKPGSLPVFLHSLGLAEYFPNKLSLRSLQEINKDSLSEKEVDSLQAVPWAFLGKLLMANTKSRSLVCASENNEANDFVSDLFSESDRDNSPNTLDLVVGLFACADSFLQQKMTLKMSMCQFAVPFLLPCGRHNQCTLMLWALRGILKEWRPHSMSESKGFVEESVVCAKIPLVSFVRLRNCSLSKSQVMNCLLSKSQQHHDFFCHRDMDGGCRPRKIANGMVEMCWYLPCGNTTIDIFPEPVVVANLRGDVAAFETQFAFLTQVSKAIFVFLDKFEEREQKMFVSSQQMNSKVHFVVNYQRDTNPDVKSSIQAVMEALKLTKEDIIVKSQNVNLAKLTDMICSTIKKCLSEHSPSLDIESMSDIAHELGISVDELTSKASSSAEKAAQNIMKGIGVREIAVYKKNQLQLQGENWKRLAQIEKEECRLQTAGDTKLEEYKAQLQKEKKIIQKTQSKYKITPAMSAFINAVTTNDSIERAFFLKWMGYKLDMRSRKYLSSLRHSFKEHCQRKDKDSLAKVDQQLLDSSLGLEHYLREMGHIYEASLGSSQRLDKLPTVAAELLQEGFPLELLDGDASSIPEKWINDVLMELHKMVGQKSRLLVLTVLGVQSTGKSTLLNTMFGVQFAVSSGRCTRGAYMLLLPVREDFRTELLCDFILLIDTEGLKSADLAQLDNSYEHDNQLATFVIGLSDVTIINVAMENFTEMKDILQIAVHAFLRMREIGKKTICYFVHQNVAGVSAHNKLRTERQHLLEHLNEMTQIAATMEKKTGINKFTEVLDYDMELNNWYIPGLWNGTPPMAPVNTGYSVAVFDFKKNMLKTLKERNGELFFNIPQFLDWTRSMWRAVKFENFIFSFQNILVAHVYDSLCKEFSEWEWSFKRHIYSWLESATIQISNTETSSLQEVEKILEALNAEAEMEIASQKREMDEKLKAYYKRKDRHVSLVERYKIDFIKNIQSLQTEMQNTVRNKLDSAFQLRTNVAKVNELHRKQAVMMEDQVLQLLKNYRGRKDELSDEDLKADFESMWNKALVNISALKERDIPSEILKELRSSFGNRKINESMENYLTQYGGIEFKVKGKEHLSKWKQFKKVFASRNEWKKMFDRKIVKQEVQSIADTAIQNCRIMIEESARLKSDYQPFLIKDLIEKIDVYIKSVNSKTSFTFEVHLKLHICDIASQKFLEMHRRFLADNDPLKRLEACKAQYLSDFIDLYRRNDQCQRKAQDFTQLCLKPAVTEYINQSIGTDIVDTILNSKYSTEYGSRSFFQYNILKELLEKEEFKEFVRYIQNYEIYVNNWIHEHIVQCFSKDLSLCELKTKKLDTILEKIDEAVKASQCGDDGCPLPNDIESTAVLIQNLCKALSKVISFPMDTVDRVLFQNTSLCTPFTNNLLECLNDLKKQLVEEIAKSSDIIEMMNSVSVKPQNELFKRVFGCGKQCPFCKAPCEAGGKDHRQHHAAVHRPQGLGRYRSVRTNILCEEICTSSVHGKGTFRNHETDFQPHPYKDYHTYYPDWLIPPDRTIEASDYWKYVLVKYNDKFAEEYKAKPAVYPSAWNNIDKVQALQGLKSAFSIK